VGVPSIDEYSLKVEELGGKVLISKTAAIKGISGFFAYCEDLENNRFGIWKKD
jgi:predicted enzyme related to lactoylglutathione lyase